MSFQKYSFILLITFSFLRGNNADYAVNKIPVELLPADAVVRVQSTTFEIKNGTRAVQTIKLAVTIFSKKEEDNGVMVLWYDKYRSLEELEGTIYDSNGEEIKTLEDSDVKDYPSFDDATLHSDTRIKVASLYHNTYPYTVEYTIEMEYNGSLNWPDWYAQRTKHPVEKTTFKVICPERYSLRHWCNRDTISPSLSNDDGNKVFEWSATNLRKFEDDDIRNYLYDLTTVVKIAPEEFQMDNYNGSMNSWKDFGLWCYSLYKGRAELPAQVSDEINALISPAKTTTEKINILFKHMQSKTRYISIQLGIGGWQPFPAEYVYTRGYGDCKALVNYMAALLNLAGIQSYPVLIQSGNIHEPMILEFPSNQFNHVILCVPLEKDTIWLECTSQDIPFNMLSNSTENRFALVLTPTGGIVVRTPATSARENLQDRFSEVTIHANGSAAAVITTNLYGNQMIDVKSSLVHKSPEERERWILERIKMPDINVHSLLFEGFTDHATTITVKLSTSFSKYASVSGERIFLYPNILERRTYVPPQVAKRVSPIHNNYPYRDQDSVFYILPKTHHMETIPKEVSITSSFGTYQSKTIAFGDTAVVHCRKIEIHETKIPAEFYNEYRNFWSEIAKTERAQIVLKRR